MPISISSSFTSPLIRPVPPDSPPSRFSPETCQQPWAVLTLSGSSAICESERSVKILPSSLDHFVMLRIHARQVVQMDGPYFNGVTVVQQGVPFDDLYRFLKTGCSNEPVTCDPFLGFRKWASVTPFLPERTLPSGASGCPLFIFPSSPRNIEIAPPLAAPRTARGFKESNVRPRPGTYPAQLPNY